MSASAQSAPFDPHFTGQVLAQPINQEILVKSIKLGLANFNWRIIEEKPGSITARYEKSEGAVFAVIRVDYDSVSYTINYVDSGRLDVDLKQLRIHRNYPRWIANLDKFIYMNYISQS